MDCCYDCERCRYYRGCYKSVRPTYEAKYLGGPLGGTTAAISEPLSRIRVPVYNRPPFYIAEAGPLPALPYHDTFVPYDTEEYQRENSSRDLDRNVETIYYRWINPAESLRAANTKLREKVAVLGPQAEKLAIIKEALA